MIVLEPETQTPDPSWSLHQIDSLLADAVGSFKLDLELQLDERADGRLAGQVVFDRDLFERATAERLAVHFERICAAVAAEPDVRVAAIPMLTEAEERRQVVEWNSTAVERPAGSVAELVAARASAAPEAIAVTDGETAIDYAELDRRAELVAGSLRDAGVGTGDAVALLARPSVDLVVGALGILKAGAGHLLLDPDLPADRLEAVIRDAGVRAILREGPAEPEASHDAGPGAILRGARRARGTRPGSRSSPAGGGLRAPVRRPGGPRAARRRRPRLRRGQRRHRPRPGARAHRRRRDVDARPGRLPLPGDRALDAADRRRHDRHGARRI